MANNLHKKQTYKERIVKVEEARMPEWTDTYGRKWKVVIKKENKEEQNIVRNGGRKR